MLWLWEVLVYNFIIKIEKNIKSLKKKQRLLTSKTKITSSLNKTLKIKINKNKIVRVYLLWRDSNNVASPKNPL